jgi:hypothetical protein
MKNITEYVIRKVVFMLAACCGIVVKAVCYKPDEVNF